MWRKANYAKQIRWRRSKYIFFQETITLKSAGNTVFYYILGIVFSEQKMKIPLRI